jgi:hypothetical protein
MQRIKITLLLPLFQFTLAVLLLAWGHTVKDPVRLDTLYVPTPTLVCLGLNAPALITWPLISRLAATPTDHPTRTAFTLGLDEMIFLAAVVVLWYLVAKWFMTIRDKKINQIQEIATSKFVGQIVTAAIGVILFIAGFSSLQLSRRLNNPAGSATECALILVWAFLLTFIPSVRLVAAVRRKLSIPNSTTG